LLGDIWRQFEPREQSWHEGLLSGLANHLDPLSLDHVAAP